MPAACPLLSRVSSLLSSTQLLPTFATSRTKVGGRLVGEATRSATPRARHVPRELGLCLEHDRRLAVVSRKGSQRLQDSNLGRWQAFDERSEDPSGPGSPLSLQPMPSGSLTMGAEQVALRGVVEGEVDQKSEERCSHPPLICQADIPAAKGRGMLANCLHKWYSRKPARGISSTL